jgi:hypothetical protein
VAADAFGLPVPSAPPLLPVPEPAAASENFGGRCDQARACDPGSGEGSGDGGCPAAEDCECVPSRAPAPSTSPPNQNPDWLAMSPQAAEEEEEDSTRLLGTGLEGHTHPRYLTLLIMTLLLIGLLVFWLLFSPAVLYASQQTSRVTWGITQRVEMCGAIALGIVLTVIAMKGLSVLCVRRGARRVHVTWLVMYFLTAVMTALPFLLWEADLAAISTALLQTVPGHSTAILAGRLGALAVLLVLEEAWKAYFGNIALKVKTATPGSVVLFTLAVAAGWSTAQQTVLSLFLWYALDVDIAAQLHLYIAVFIPIALLAQHLVSGVIIGLRLGALRRIHIARHPDGGFKFRWPIWIPVLLRVLWVVGSVLSYTHTIIIGGVAFAVWVPFCTWACWRHWREMWSDVPTVAAPPEAPPANG